MYTECISKRGGPFRLPGPRLPSKALHANGRIGGQPTRGRECVLTEGAVPLPGGPSRGAGGALTKLFLHRPRLVLLQPLQLHQQQPLVVLQPLHLVPLPLLRLLQAADQLGRRLQDQHLGGPRPVAEGGHVAPDRVEAVLEVDAAHALHRIVQAAFVGVHRD